MTITISELEGFFCTFGAAFLGYLVSAAFVVSNATVEAAAITGGIAGLAYLGYNVVSGNVSTKPA